MTGRPSPLDCSTAVPSGERDCVVIDRVDHTKQASYSVYFGSEVLATIAPDLMVGRKVLVVTTPSVHERYGKQLIEASAGHLSEGDFLVMDCNEASKNLDEVNKVCARALTALDRNGLIVGFGGGVVMDIACFAASMIRRGIGYVKIPTTLVGQVDAGIGIKGGVNYAEKKSFLGCFYAPETVLVQPAFLNTLDKSHLSAGIAEMLKMAIIADARLFNLIEQHSEAFLTSGFMAPAGEANDALIQSINLMLDELRPNLTEQASYERPVDFGHTFGPALEAAIGFSIPHGFTVAIDMALSAALSVGLGRLSEDELNRILACLDAAGLPVWHDSLTEDLCRAALREAVAHRGGNVNLVIPTAIGACTFIRSETELGDRHLRDALEKIANARDGLQRES